MSGSRPILVFSFVVSATAAAVVWLWPNGLLAFGAGFLGLTVLHLYTLLRLGRAEADLAEVLTGRGRKASREPSSSGATVEAFDLGGFDWEHDLRPARKERRKPAPKEEETPGDADGSRQVEDFLKLRLETDIADEAEDISFLPPYASEADADGPEADSPDADPGGAELAVGAGAQEGPEATPGAAGEEPDAAGRGEGGAPRERYRNVPIPRHFALGTVAIIRNMLTPAEVAQILVEQRKRPRERFGEVAVEMGFLDHTQLQTLLLAQQEGLFTDEEIREARIRLKAFREAEASEATVPANG